MEEFIERAYLWLPALDFESHGGERTERQEIKDEEERRCKREFFDHNHEFTDTTEANKENSNKIRCYNCNNTLDKYKQVGCLECKIYLHQNCATKGLQLYIRHIYHPFHRLALKSYDSDDCLIRCNACNKKVYAGKFMFDCKSCNFHLCIQCSLQYPNIKDTTVPHHHLLSFFSESSHDFFHEDCKKCGDLFDSDDLIVRCVNCNISLHLHCYPSLPHTIKHQCHVDPLTLITDPDLVRSDQGYDEFYCDVCEKERNVKHPVYCCNECLFVAHMKCVVSEVLPLITLPESDLATETTTMYEQSDIFDDHYFGDIIGNKAMEIETIEKLRTEEKIKDLDTIQSVEYYLGNTTGDKAMAREFFAKLKLEEINRENGVGKYKDIKLADLNKEIEKLCEGITEQTQILESTKANLKDFNAKLKKVEAQRAKLLQSAIL